MDKAFEQLSPENKLFVTNMYREHKKVKSEIRSKIISSKKCSGCDEVASRECKLCGADFYCSKECQKNTHKDHKKKCKTLRATPLELGLDLSEASDHPLVTEPNPVRASPKVKPSIIECESCWSKDNLKMFMGKLLCRTCLELERGVSKTS